MREPPTRAATSMILKVVQYSFINLFYDPKRVKFKRQLKLKGYRIWHPMSCKESLVKKMLHLQHPQHQKLKL